MPNTEKSPSLSQFMAIACEVHGASQLSMSQHYRQNSCFPSFGKRKPTNQNPRVPGRAPKARGLGCRKLVTEGAKVVEGLVLRTVSPASAPTALWLLLTVTLLMTYKTGITLVTTAATYSSSCDRYCALYTLS